MPTADEAARRREPAPAPPDRELVSAARAGESWAARALYERHRRMVRRIASRVAGADDREDLVQDAFLKALCSLDQIENPELFGSWLASVVVRTAAHAFNRRRQLARLDGGGMVDQLTSPAAPPDVLADLRAVYRVLENLPVESRLVFILRRVERMSIVEVAAHLGRSMATVKRRLARAEGLLNRRMRLTPAGQRIESGGTDGKVPTKLRRSTAQSGSRSPPTQASMRDCMQGSRTRCRTELTAG
jgi:RNA polymerase sigma-70 factor (ECF subfamily)